MNYADALALIKTEFETRFDSSHSEVIRTGYTYDGCNGFCLCLYDLGDRAILTDMGETAQFFIEVTDEEWGEFCAAVPGFRFNHWHIEHEINDIQDVYDFIGFLDEISDKFFLLDDE